MASSTVEDYVKQLYLEQQHHPGGLVPMGRLARLMDVVPGTATTMTKALADAGLAAAEVGEVVPGAGALRLAEPGGGITVLAEPQPDPYWPAYGRAVAEGWE